MNGLPSNRRATDASSQPRAVSITVSDQNQGGHPRSRGFEPLERDIAKPTTERALFSFRISGFEHQRKI